MRVLLIGPPGPQGTQASRIADHSTWPGATGDLLREQVVNGTELGKVAKEYMDKGDLVPDDLVIEMTRRGCSRPARRAGTSWMATRAPGPGRGRLPLGAVPGDPLQPDPELRDRGGGAVRPPGWPGQGAHRFDDTEETIRHRLEVFAAQTRPLVDTTSGGGPGPDQRRWPRSTPSARRSSPPSTGTRPGPWPPGSAGPVALGQPWSLAATRTRAAGRGARRPWRGATTQETANRAAATSTMVAPAATRHLEGDGQADDAAGGAEDGGEGHGGAEALGPEAGRGRGGDDQGHGQDGPHGRDRGDHGDLDQHQQHDVEHEHRVAQGGQPAAVEGAEDQLLVEGGEHGQHRRADQAVVTRSPRWTVMMEPTR